MDTVFADERHVDTNCGIPLPLIVLAVDVLHSSLFTSECSIYVDLALIGDTGIEADSVRHDGDSV